MLAPCLVAPPDQKTRVADDPDMSVVRWVHSTVEHFALFVSQMKRKYFTAIYHARLRFDHPTQ
jgi:hypothetical protein